MVIIRINGNVPPVQAELVEKSIFRQASTGVIVLPHFCELLNEVPADENVKVVYKQEADGEKEREAKEYARRIKEKLCSTCKERYAPVSQSSCWACSCGNLYRKE